MNHSSESSVESPRTVTRTLDVRSLGLVEYEPTLRLQEQLVAARIAGQTSDTLLLLEHPPTITYGRSSKPGELLVSGEFLAEIGVKSFDAGRGGAITYHGPGQLVGYPIIDLKPNRKDVHRYMRDLEEVMIRTAAHFDVRAVRVTGKTGVWVGEQKLGALGVRISHWVTMHGFALNVNTDLTHFRWIVPCGLTDCEVTSLAALTSTPLKADDVAPVAADVFADIFGYRAAASGNANAG